MQADYSVELGGDAPALEIPWHPVDPTVRYYDLKNHPELIQQIPEAVAYPELASFLSRMNTPGFPMATAKCDAWSSDQVDPEEEIFGDRKFVSYVDLVFTDEADQRSFQKHEDFSKELCRLLSHAPEIAAKVELIIRHCYYHQINLPVGGRGSKAMLPELAGTETQDERIQERAQGSQIELKTQDEQIQVVTQVKQLRLQEKCSGENLHKTALSRDPVETEDKQLQLENECREEDQPRKTALPLNPAATEGKQIQLKNRDNRTQMKTNDLEVDTHTQKTLPTDSSETQEKQSQMETDVSGENPQEKIVLLPDSAGLEGKQLQLEHDCSDENSSAEYPTASSRGFCITAYVTGFGGAEHEPFRLWAISLNLLQHAIVQLARPAAKN